MEKAQARIPEKLCTAFLFVHLSAEPGYYTCVDSLAQQLAQLLVICMHQPLASARRWSTLANLALSFGAQEEHQSPNLCSDLYSRQLGCLKRQGSMSLKTDLH